MSVRQGYCYTCLAIGGGISVGSLRLAGNLVVINSVLRVRKKGSFQKSPFSRYSREAQTVENRGESDSFLEKF